MGIKFNVPGKERKKLVQKAAEWDGSEVNYLGAPTFTYRIGDHLTVDRDGVLEIHGMDESGFEMLVEHLLDEGFDCDMSAAPTEESESTDTTHLDVSVPADTLDGIAMQNLEALIAAKGNLIRKALGADELPVLNLRGEIHFPWFDISSSPEEAQTYVRFIGKLIDMAKNAKRVTAKEKDTDNDKYAFRCFLLRLGFIGDEYKSDRKVLLKNLSGSSAFKNGQKKEAAECSE